MQLGIFDFETFLNLSFLEDNRVLSTEYSHVVKLRSTDYQILRFRPVGWAAQATSALHPGTDYRRPR